MDRRDFLRSATAGAALLTAAPARAQPARVEQEAATASHPPHRPRAAPGKTARLFLTDAEAAFAAAVVEVMIPADAFGPGGVEAGVVAFMDRQLAGAWGAGARQYLDGPWAEGTSQQGYQLPLNPAALFRLAVAETDALARAETGKPFAQMAVEQRDGLLRRLDAGDAKLATLSGATVVELLRTSAVEGYFADPAHGGNRGMAAWRMIGYPGARGAYVDEIERFRGRRFVADPVSLADLQP